MLRILVIIASLVLLVESRFVDFKPRFPDSKQALFLRQLNAYDVIIPTAVDEEGKFVSHDLKDGHRRIRRSSPSELNNIYFKVHINRNELHLKVSRNDKLLSPGFVFETRGNSSDVRNHKIVQEKSEHHHCHYLGQIVSQPDSHVAISNCYGIRGYIHTNDGQYLIEPVFGHDLTSEPRHPHIIYKRPVHQGAVDEDALPMTSRAQQLYQQIKGGLTDDASTNERHKRSTSLERNVEVLVVADPLMVDYYHDRGDIQLYILTVMNMVTGMYRDVSIGNVVNIVLVRVMLLSEDQDKLQIVHNARPTLDSFSSWQQSVNMESDDHPNHHDVAVLITRKDICAGSNRPCLTLGLSNIAAMCDPAKSSNINDDTGLNVAFTIAHELGHNLGMKHDGDGNACKWSPKHVHYIMNGTMPSSVAPLIWSPCSRDYITLFLDRGWGDCLLDKPSKHEFDYPDVPPGVMYDAEHQCRLRYGPSVSVCYPEDICRTLWCSTGTCHTKMGGAAPGTKCGKNKWCMNGHCVEMSERAVAIDGDWGTWSEWSSCSRTCGGGVSTMHRECNNPRPAKGGKYCLGKRERYALCNTQPCPAGSRDFREVQCSFFNNQRIRNNFFRWEPYIKKGQECALVCRPTKSRKHAEVLRSKVVDGTSCGIEKRGICISGICQKVGCDNKIDSNAVEDQCGVCHGDGSTCETIKSNITQYGVGYKEVVVIPVGARNILVHEVAASVNYLALKGQDGAYFLNGNWFIKREGYYKAAGTTVVYKRRNNLEKFMATGPLTEPLTIEVLMQDYNADLSVEYTIPKNNTEFSDVQRIAEFKWEHGEWTHCSATCGGGEQISEAICVEKLAGLVENFYCNQTTKPDHNQRSCNINDCPATWWKGNWQSCSVTCGNNGTRMRSVFCIRSFGYDEQSVIEDEECLRLGAEKPVNFEPCNLDITCPIEPVWIIGNWSECSSYCGVGTQHRIVVCNSRKFCEVSARPESVRECSNHCDVVSHVSESHDYENFEIEDGGQSDQYFINQQSDKIPVTFGEWERLNKQSTDKQQKFLQKLVTRNKNHPERKTDEDIVLAIDNAALMAPVDSDEAMQRHLLPSRKEEIEKMFKTVEEYTVVPYRNPDKIVWRVGEWQECSVSCGEGISERTVECINLATNETDNRCFEKDKPDTINSCSTHPCPIVSGSVVPQERCTGDRMPYTRCQLLKSRGNCQYLKYKMECCLTCG